MKALIIHYSLKKAKEKHKSKIQRILYGYKDYSNRGTYSYERKEIVKDIPHKKVDQRVIIILEKDKKEVISILKENKAEIELIPINIQKSYLKK